MAVFLVSICWLISIVSGENSTSNNSLNGTGPVKPTQLSATSSPTSTFPNATTLPVLHKFGMINLGRHCPILDRSLTIRSGSFEINPYFSMNHSHIKVCEHYLEDAEQWPDGNFCVFRIPDTICPGNSKQEYSSVISNGEIAYTEDECCIHTNSYTKTPVTWPLGSEPFCIMTYYEGKCQAMENFQLTSRNITFKIENTSRVVRKSGSRGANIVNLTSDVYSVQMCCYSENNPPPGESSDDTNKKIYGSVFGSVGGTVLVFCLFRLYKRRRRLLKKGRNSSENVTMKNLGAELKPKGKSELGIGSLLKMILDSESQITIYGLLIHPDKIEKLDQVGKGAFGTVYYGRYRPDDNPLHAQEVAIKTLKDNCIYPEISAFMEEAIIMADFHHPNVLNILGVCVDPKVDTPALVLPFMQHGDLQKYLRKFRYDEDKMDKAPELVHMLSFCLHIARGMEYLSNMKFVHRDLAARNCMLNGEMVVKVADFGLTRDIYSSSYYRQDKNKLLPIKWMAVESLQDRVFSVYTDVWSYGVTLWEIFTLGKVPYPNLDNTGVLSALERGHRLEKPDTCPDTLFEVLLQCWLVNPKDRPTFADILAVFEDALARLGEYLDLDGNSPGKAMDLTTGIVSKPRDSAVTESDLAVKKGQVPYADYRMKENEVG